MHTTHASRWRCRRLLTVLTVSTLLQSGLIAPSIPSASGAVVTRGDANCDDQVRFDDIAAMRRSIFAGTPGGPEACTGADVNQDESVSVADLVAVLEPVLGSSSPGIAVFLMGDGMGPVHVRAGAIAHQRPLTFEQFPVRVAAMDTSSLDTLETGEPTDSAAGATAFATGVRVFNGEVSRHGSVDLVTLGELAQAAGKSVGIVTNSYLFDASPAAFVAHTAQRDRLAEIADQYLEAAPEVLIGAVPRRFRDLDAFIARARARGYTVVRSAAELDALDLQAVTRLLGLFSIDFDIGLDPIGYSLFPIYGTPALLRMPAAPDPSLSRAAEVAATVLGRNPFGFFLFVENENTDTMSHAGLYTDTTIRPLGALVASEVSELSNATDQVMAALTSVGRLDDTLLVVTADHECGGFTFPDDDPSAGTFPAAPNHTGVPVPLYASGNGAERFAAIRDNIEVFDAIRPALR